MTVDRTRTPHPTEPAGPPPPAVARPLTDDERFRRAWVRNLAEPASAVRRRTQRLVLTRRGVGIAALVLGVVLGVTVGAGYLISRDLTGNVARLPGVFDQLDPADRPAPGKSLTFLLVGTDSRSSGPTTGSGANVEPGSVRSDVLMIARLNPDRTTAAVASIPRDSWVDIPGHGRDKINAAYALGGPPLLVETVENLTGIRFDHFAVIDFAGFRSMVDAVGGIDVGIDTPGTADGVAFRAGVNHLDGRAALAYVRQRYGLVGGDLDREQRQQNVLRALVTRVADQGTLSSPAATLELLDAVSRSVSVDDTLDDGGLRGLASTLHGLGPSDVTFVRAPVEAFGREGARSVVYLNPSRSAELWRALSDDRVALYADAHPGDTLGPVTR